MFLMTDNQIVKEQFLVYINDLLSTGVVSDLFTQVQGSTSGMTGCSMTSRAWAWGASLRVYAATRCAHLTHALAFFCPPAFTGGQGQLLQCSAQ